MVWCDALTCQNVYIHMFQFFPLPLPLPHLPDMRRSLVKDMSALEAQTPLRSLSSLLTCDQGTVCWTLAVALEEVTFTW